jgi:hypothetical protein
MAEMIQVRPHTHFSLCRRIEDQTPALEKWEMGKPFHSWSTFIPPISKTKQKYLLGMTRIHDTFTVMVKLLVGAQESFCVSSNPTADSNNICCVNIVAGPLVGF